MQSDGGNKEIDFEELALSLAAVGKEMRLRLLALLMSSREPLCVCELAAGVELPEYETSRNLAALRRAGLVTCRRDGLWAYYGVADSPLMVALETILAPRDEDQARLRSRLGQRVAGRCVVGPTGPSGKEPPLRHGMGNWAGEPPGRQSSTGRAKETR
ncbi:MAG: metalloregulator ArsR/SmtB family transcription factor [Candidatus Bipolaricaulota bacterium]